MYVYSKVEFSDEYEFVQYVGRLDNLLLLLSFVFFGSYIFFIKELDIVFLFLFLFVLFSIVINTFQSIYENKVGNLKYQIEGVEKRINELHDSIKGEGQKDFCFLGCKYPIKYIDLDKIKPLLIKELDKKKSELAKLKMKKIKVPLHFIVFRFFYTLCGKI